MDRYVIVGPVVQPSAVGDFLARHVALRLPLGLPEVLARDSRCCPYGRRLWLRRARCYVSTPARAAASSTWRTALCWRSHA